MFLLSLFPTCIKIRASCHAPCSLSFFIFLSINPTDFTISFPICFLIFFLYCYITFLFVFFLNLAAHNLLKPPQSICPTLSAPSVAVFIPSVLLFACALSRSVPCLSYFDLPLSISDPTRTSVFSRVAMLERMSRRSRSLLSLTLTSLALALSILALCTSYWCEGTHKVVKPLCLSPVKMKNCGQNNSEPYTTGRKLNISKGVLYLFTVNVLYIHLQCHRQKEFTPFLISLLFGYLLNLNISDQTNFNILNKDNQSKHNAVFRC